MLTHKLAGVVREEPAGEHGDPRRHQRHPGV